MSGSTATVVGTLPFNGTQQAFGFWRRAGRVIVPDYIGNVVRIYNHLGQLGDLHADHRNLDAVRRGRQSVGKPPGDALAWALRGQGGSRSTTGDREAIHRAMQNALCGALLSRLPNGCHRWQPLFPRDDQTPGRKPLFYEIVCPVATTLDHARRIRLPLGLNFLACIYGPFSFVTSSRGPVVGSPLQQFTNSAQ